MQPACKPRAGLRHLCKHEVCDFLDDFLRGGPTMFSMLFFRARITPFQLKDVSSPREVHRNTTAGRLTTTRCNISTVRRKVHSLLASVSTVQAPFFKMASIALLSVSRNLAWPVSSRWVLFPSPGDSEPSGRSIKMRNNIPVSFQNCFASCYNTGPRFCFFLGWQQCASVQNGHFPRERG